MSLAPGQRLGPYEVVAPLGAGGMGEVWRARDTRLGREVAIKVLPAAFAADPSLRARIEREAKTISSLNHPHICTLHDIGREGETDYLVLELVEGETLALRLARGPLSPAEVLRYGIQIADALERAHRAGIVHRDLKPGNIMLTRSGAKLLDFGLARGGTTGDDSGLKTISPTMAEPLTRAGHIVGTFQYMAPEQLEGAEPDPRSDLWALGCVLYEMATGKAPFTGGSQASLISSIMKDEPKAIGEVAPLSPPALERVVQQCLAKDPEERWQTAGDLRRELAWISSSGSQASPLPAAPAAGLAAPPNRRLPSLLRSSLLPVLAGAAIVGLLWLAVGRARPPAAPVRLALLHEGPGRILRDPTNSAISPDGQMVAFAAIDSTGFAIHLRRLSESQARLLVRSTTAIYSLFWSPDSRHVAYFTVGDEGRLWRVPVAGGPPIALAPSSTGRGGTWNEKGDILYAPKPRGPLFRIPAEGGVPVQATVLDTARGQDAHRAPQFLPDGDHFLFAGLPGTGQLVDIFVGSLRTGKVERLDVRSQTGVLYAEPGYLLTTREGKLLARRFDPRRRRLGGDEFVVVDAMDFTDRTGSPNVSVSRNGRLVWRPSLATRSRLDWVDRGGRTLGTLETVEGRCDLLAVRPDGRGVLGTRMRTSGVIEVFHHDPDRGSSQRMSPDGVEGSNPVWSPDGESFYMNTQVTGRHEIYRQSLGRVGRPELVATTDHQFKRPRGITPDGRTLLLTLLNQETGWDVYRKDLTTDAPPEPVLEDPASIDAFLSPDGRTLAIVGGSGAIRVLLVAPFERPNAQRRVSSSLITQPFWRADGRELYFDTLDSDGLGVWSLPMAPAGGTPTGPARLLFKRRGIQAWAPAPDGQRFLVSITDRMENSDEIRVDLDWPSLARMK